MRLTLNLWIPAKAGMTLRLLLALPLVVGLSGCIVVKAATEVAETAVGVGAAAVGVAASPIVCAASAAGVGDCPWTSDNDDEDDDDDDKDEAQPDDER